MMVWICASCLVLPWWLSSFPSQVLSHLGRGLQLRYFDRDNVSMSQSIHNVLCITHLYCLSFGLVVTCHTYSFMLHNPMKRHLNAQGWCSFIKKGERARYKVQNAKENGGIWMIDYKPYFILAKCTQDMQKFPIIERLTNRNNIP